MKSGSGNRGVRAGSDLKRGRNAAGSNTPETILINSRLLTHFPLPEHADGDKEDRGTALIIGGSADNPGAVILAGIAALRAGCGKVRIAAPRSVALHLAISLPESRVHPLPETKSGEISVGAADLIAEAAQPAPSILIGPGMLEKRAARELLNNLIPKLGRARVVLDALALSYLTDRQATLKDSGIDAVLTPHAGEMAMMMGVSKSNVQNDTAKRAREAAELFGAVMVLKGPETFVTGRDGKVFCNKAGNAGLATAGSGDTLAGIITGLRARGAGSLDAAIWGSSPPRARWRAPCPPRWSARLPCPRDPTGNSRAVGRPGKVTSGTPRVQRQMYSAWQLE